MKKRKVLEWLLEQRNDRKISILLGARQVGKTTLLKALYTELCAAKKNKGIYVDIDIFSNFEKISTFENLVNFIKLHGYDEMQKEFFYLFLDEFQRYADISMIMKNVYDNLHNVKIYASGSSSIKIKSQIQESLAGRKRIHLIYPLDFEEFLWFKEDAEAIEQYNNIKKLHGADLDKATGKLNRLLEEFLVYGGYPEVVLVGKQQKEAVLESIFDLYIKKDLVEYLSITKVMNVKKLIEYLAINNSKKITYEELCSLAQLNVQEAKNYIEIIKETHLITLLRPFFTNKNKELVKIPKPYFIDNGVRNYFIKNFNALSLREDRGFLFEAFIVSELLKSGIDADSLKFWQDKNKHEVDIVIDYAQSQIPIEVKYTNKVRKEDYIGLNAFLSEYACKKAYLVNIGEQNTNKLIKVILPFGLNIINL